jgi:hypothetical protein
VKILTVRAPWSWFIIHAGKDVENRSQRTHYRGPVLIQTSLRKPPQQEFDKAINFAHRLGVSVHKLAQTEMRGGGVIGLVQLVSCSEHSDSRWFTGPYAWGLRNPVALPFVAMRGQMGLFEAPAAVMAELRRKLRERGEEHLLAAPLPLLDPLSGGTK